MNLTLLFLLNNILLGVGLTMDAFSVSIANCIREPKMRALKMCVIAGTFAAFQAIMPMTGWICVRTIAQHFATFQKFIPWIALALLCYIGGKMLLEGLHEKKIKAECNAQETLEACAVPVRSSLTFFTLLAQGVATSIDALSVGFAISEYGTAAAIFAAIIIAAVTFIICLAGCVIGKKVGDKFSSNATIIGGIILVAIGIEIFVKGIF